MGSQFFAINNINRQNASKGRPQRDQGDPPQSHWRRSRCIVRPCSQDRSAGFVAKEGWRRYRKSNWRLERTPCHRQAHHPKPSSRVFRRPLCLVSRHQGLEGTPPRPKEGEEHQALRSAWAARLTEEVLRMSAMILRVERSRFRTSRWSTVSFARILGSILHNRLCKQWH